MVAEKDNTKWKVKHLKIRGTGTRANRASDLRQWRIIAEREPENVLHIGSPKQVTRARYVTIRKPKKNLHFWLKQVSHDTTFIAKTADDQTSRRGSVI